MLLLQALSYIPGGKIMYYTLRRHTRVAKIVSSHKNGGLCTVKFKRIWMEALVVLHRHSVGGTEKNHENFPVMALCMSSNKLR